MQHIKVRRGHGPARRQSRRVGADATFAKEMARSAFGRFYVDDQQLREVARSLARAKRRRDEAQPRSADPVGTQKPSAKSSGKPKLWHRPGVRERRSEMAEALARLAAGAKRRKTEEPGERR